MGDPVDISAMNAEVYKVKALEQDAEGNYYPEAEMSWCGSFTYPVGSENNPVYPEWEWDEAWANATASVTVAAGETVYFSGDYGMILTINGVVTEMSETGVFAITNDGESEATYVLAVATPVGDNSNPEVIETIPFTGTGSLEVDGAYCYIWTATEDATIVLTVSEGANIIADKLTYLPDEEWPISEQYELAVPEEDDNWNYIGWIVEEQLVIDVTAGQQVKIQINALTDLETWSTPAIDYTLNITVNS